MSEKVTKDEIVVEEGKVYVPYNERMHSVMEMYRWLKEQIKGGADEEELERVWNDMRGMSESMKKLP